MKRYFYILSIFALLLSLSACNLEEVRSSELDILSLLDLNSVDGTVSAIENSADSYDEIVTSSPDADSSENLHTTVQQELSAQSNADSISAAVYVCESNNYSISTNLDLSMADISETGNEDMIILDNLDRSLSVICQRVLKELAVQRASLESLDAFASYDIANKFGSMNGARISENTAPYIENALNVKQYSIVVDYDSLTAMAKVTYIETEHAYYIISATGVEGQFLPAEAQLDMIPKTFTELAR